MSSDWAQRRADEGGTLDADQPEELRADLTRLGVRGPQQFHLTTGTEPEDDVEEDVASDHLLHGGTDGGEKGQETEALGERGRLVLLQRVHDARGGNDVMQQREDLEDGSRVLGEKVVLRVRK